MRGKACAASLTQAGAVQVKPSLVPMLKDATDVSNFDDVFTSDRSWKHSALLRCSAADEDDDVTGEDPFADFHYVSRVSSEPCVMPGVL
jgi:hypothetical protein